jgi:hypothetical protein
MNARQSHYVVVSSGDIAKLAETVRLKQDEGWVTCGGLAVDISWYFDPDLGRDRIVGTTFMQAMTRQDS